MQNFVLALSPFFQFFQLRMSIRHITNSRGSRVDIGIVRESEKIFTCSSLQGIFIFPSLHSPFHSHSHSSQQVHLTTALSWKNENWCRLWLESNEDKDDSETWYQVDFMQEFEFSFSHLLASLNTQWRKVWSRKFFSIFIVPRWWCPKTLTVLCYRGWRTANNEQWKFSLLILACIFLWIFYFMSLVLSFFYKIQIFLFNQKIQCWIILKRVSRWFVSRVVINPCIDKNKVEFDSLSPLYFRSIEYLWILWGRSSRFSRLRRVIGLLVDCQPADIIRQQLLFKFTS